MYYKAGSHGRKSPGDFPQFFGVARFKNVSTGFQTARPMRGLVSRGMVVVGKVKNANIVGAGSNEARHALSIAERRTTV
jgi:hypothetical protein